MSKKSSAQKHLSKLIDIMARLRGPRGCPWDKHQTHKSLLPYLFSEASELRRAERKKDWMNFEEELGDVLLQVVFHSRIAEEKGLFSIADVISGLNKKLLRRHPHVFGKVRLKKKEEVVKLWEDIKKLEKKGKLNARG